MLMQPNQPLLLCSVCLKQSCYADAAKPAIATVLSVFEAILSYADAAKYAIATVPQCVGSNLELC